MTRYLLDTNIVSDLVRDAPSPAIQAWMGDQRDDTLHIATMTLAEIWRGVLQMSQGRRRQEFEHWFHGPDGPPRLFAGRILPFDDAAAMAWARLMAEGALAGRPRSALDTIIAAIALANNCVVVTGNTRHFAGIETLNPMQPT